MAPRSNEDRRLTWIAIGVLLSAGFLLSMLLLRLIDATGLWMDDAVYLVNAQSLAEGHGYRHMHLPGEPWQTKYPPLYPLVLSLVMRMGASLASTETIAHLLNAAVWMLACVLVFHTARRWWKMPVWLAGAGALLGLLEPQSLDLTHSTMSEPLHAFLSIAAVCVATHASREKSERWWVWAVGAGVLAALSVWTRSIGVTCAFACVAGMLLGRKWKPALACGIVIVILVGALVAWRSGLHARNAAIPQAAALGYDLDYRLWMGGDLSGLVRVAWLNSGDLLLSVTQRIAPWPVEWLDWAIGEGWVTESLFLAWCGIVCGSIAVGAMVSWERGGATVALYVASYLGLTMIWPFPPSRFVMPITPLLSVLFLLGLTSSVAWIVRLVVAKASVGDAVAVRTRAAKVGESFAGRLAPAIVVVLLSYTVLQLTGTIDNPNAARWVAERDLGIKLITDRTPAGSVVAGPSPGYIYLATGRQSVILAPADEPIAQRYPASRSWRMLGIDAMDADEAYFRALYETRLEGMYRGAGVTHILVPGAGEPRARLMLEYFAKNPARFRAIGREGPYTLFEYSPPVGAGG